MSIVLNNSSSKSETTLKFTEEIKEKNGNSNAHFKHDSIHFGVLIQKMKMKPRKTDYRNLVSELIWVC